MREVHLIPRALSLCLSEASSSALCCNSNPSKSATISRVMSSVVGPSPPVTNRISARENSTASVSRIAWPSGTVRRSSMRKPKGKISRAMNARCASCTSPSRSSVPVFKTTTRMWEHEPLKELQGYNRIAACLPIQPYGLFNLVKLLTFLTSGRRPLRRVFVLLLTNERKLFAFHYCAIDRDFGDIFAARHLVHDVEHDPFEHRPQRARPGSLRDRLRRQGAQGVFCHRQPHAFHREKLRVLLDHRIFRLGQNRHHFFLRQGVERTDNRQSPDELRNHPESEQVFRLNMADGLLSQRFFD